MERKLKYQYLFLDAFLLVKDTVSVIANVVDGKADHCEWILD